MKLKKILAAMMVGAMVIGTVPATSATVYAAKGGAKVSAPKSAPAPAAPKSNASSNSTTQKAGPNNKDYAPSKSAKDLQKDAPAAKANTAASAAKTNSGSRWGNIMRNVGLFAGGMFLGSMLSHLFGGMGTGMMADIMGLLMNIIMFAVVIMVIRWAWNKFRGNKNGGNDYQRGYEQAMREQQRHDSQMIDVTPNRSEQPKIMDIKPPANGADYEPKSTADRYRNR